MEKDFDYDEIIALIMENESASKNLTDEEYQKVILFFKNKFFDFLVFLINQQYKNSSLSKKEIKDKIISFSLSTLRKINHNKVDIELNAISNLIDNYYLIFT